MRWDFIFLIIVLLVIFIRVLLGVISFEEDFYDWDKLLFYECGFVRLKIFGDFFFWFFYLVILFLVWDVEIVFLILCF